MREAEQIWHIPSDHPSFAGHFPARPIVAGVILLDRVLLLAQTLVQASADGWQVGQVKFLSPALPGDTLRFRVQEGARQWSFRVDCAERQIASGTLVPPRP